MRKKKLNRSRRVEGTPDVSLIEMESSACVFFGDNNVNADRSERGQKTQVTPGRCFLFVFPSSEVIDEHLGLMSVKAYHVYLRTNFFRNML